jgi:hypothetical protein
MVRQTSLSDVSKHCMNLLESVCMKSSLEAMSVIKCQSDNRLKSVIEHVSIGPSDRRQYKILGKCFLCFIAKNAVWRPCGASFM